MIALRSLMFYCGLFPVTIIFCLIGIAILPFNRVARYRIVTQWSRFALWWLKLTCHLSSRVRGRENIPDEPCVVFCKHQSAWETMALQFILPPHVQVVKRELLLVPFFGWGLASLNPIAIDRKAGARALRHVLKVGTERLRDGWWVLLFPEGTRTIPGERHAYAPSAAALAIRAKCPLLPVAHNAGVYWSRNALIKFPGEIELVIGPALRAENRNAETLTALASEWVETQCATMPQAALEEKQTNDSMDDA